MFGMLFKVQTVVQKRNSEYFNQIIPMLPRRNLK